RNRSAATNLFFSLRPDQWTKNLLVFAPLIFAETGKLFDPASVIRSSEAFVVFCALSGVVYLVNDVVDRESDRLHPLKALRPIASGALGVRTAGISAAVIACAALAGSIALGWRFAAVAIAYLALQGLYSTLLKHIVIMDVLTRAIGFVLRAGAGAVAIDVEIGHWLLVCTILLALFIALAKRRHEIVMLGGEAP